VCEGIIVGPIEGISVGIGVEIEDGLLNEEMLVIFDF